MGCLELDTAGLLMLLMSIFTRNSIVSCKSANKLQDGLGCFNSHAVAVVSGVGMRPTWPILRGFPRSEFLVCKKSTLHLSHKTPHFPWCWAWWATTLTLFRPLSNQLTLMPSFLHGQGGHSWLALTLWGLCSSLQPKPLRILEFLIPRPHLAPVKV